jgi:hypothetical protein
MDSKDFIKHIKQQISDAQKKALSTYSFKTRQSRPRAKENIIAPHLKNI